VREYGKPARYSCTAIGAMLDRSEALARSWAVLALATTESTTLVGGRADVFVLMDQQTGLVVEKTGSSVERRDVPRRRSRLSCFSTINERRQALVTGRSTLWGIAVPSSMSRGHVSTSSR
jgi:hypothetical protein